MWNVKETAEKLYNQRFKYSVLKFAFLSWIIYSVFACHKNQRSVFFFLFIEIGDIAGVADVTIRQSYRLIYLRAAELFPSDFKFTTPVDKLPNLWSVLSSAFSQCRYLYLLARNIRRGLLLSITFDT